MKPNRSANVPDPSHPGRRGALLLAFVLLLASGCGGSTPLMPTPNIYARGLAEPFENVPPALQSDTVDVLYMTDRKPEPGSTPGSAKYGIKRSRSVGYGIATVKFGKDVSWEQLERASKTSKRNVKLPMRIVKTVEIGRFPDTPRSLAESDVSAPIADTAGTRPTTTKIERDEQIARAEALLSERLARVPDKEVFIFVHGYNNKFYDAVVTIAGLWHFLGRRGVPVAYTWPAGQTGLLRGYTYDRESSEFTVFHLKQMIREVAHNPDVKKINLIGHSRGTDVVISALRELHLEINGAGRSTREELKLGTLVLAAPDIDFDVMAQRMMTARLGRIPERFVLYVCSKDSALGMSNWLFAGGGRVGKLRSDMFTPEELKVLRATKTVQIVDARIKNPGAFGHDYFHSNPAVSSDLIMVMRYHMMPAEEYGRPLGADGKGFWIVDDKYPKRVRLPPTPPTTRPTSAAAASSAPAAN
jgi:esterase/lipase superfamily enzyme